MQSHHLALTHDLLTDMGHGDTIFPQQNVDSPSYSRISPIPIHSTSLIPTPRAPSPPFLLRVFFHTTLECFAYLIAYRFLFSRVEYHFVCTKSREKELEAQK